MKIPRWLSLTASFVLVGFLVVLYFVWHPVVVPESMRITNAPSYNHALTIGGTELSVAYATTEREQAQGLSGAAPLTSTNGMLFVFSEPATVPFWMKDMRYPIDIIWIGTDKTIKDISANLDPKSYPATFSPKEPVQYVLEVEAGFFKKHALSIGMPVSF